MSPGADRLRLRRAVLLRRGELQRLNLRGHLTDIEATLSPLDHGFNTARRFVTPPVLLAAGVLLTLFLGRGRTKRGLAGGIALVGLVLRIRSTGRMLAAFVKSQVGPGPSVRRSR